MDHLYCELTYTVHIPVHSFARSCSVLRAECCQRARAHSTKFSAQDDCSKASQKRSGVSNNGWNSDRNTSELTLERAGEGFSRSIQASRCIWTAGLADATPRDKTRYHSLLVPLLASGFRLPCSCQPVEWVEAGTTSRGDSPHSVTRTAG